MPPTSFSTDERIVRVSTVLVISTGELHMLGVIALRLRKAVLQLIVSEECDTPQAVTSAIMLFAEVHNLSPELAFYDPTLAVEMGCTFAFRRLDGETITISRSSDQRAVIRLYDQDDIVQHEWGYVSEDKALRAIHQWNIATEDAPPEYVGEHREVSRFLHNPRRTTS